MFLQEGMNDISAHLIINDGTIKTSTTFQGLHEDVIADTQVIGEDHFGVLFNDGMLQIFNCGLQPSGEILATKVTELRQKLDEENEECTTTLSVCPAGKLLAIHTMSQPCEEAMSTRVVEFSGGKLVQKATFDLKKEEVGQMDPEKQHYVGNLGRSQGQTFVGPTQDGNLLFCVVTLDEPKAKLLSFSVDSNSGQMKKISGACLDLELSLPIQIHTLNGFIFMSDHDGKVVTGTYA